jgi:hypothetical protein
MQNKEQGTNDVIEAVTADQPVQLAWTPAPQEDGPAIETADSVDNAMAGEAARAVLLENFGGFEELAAQVAGPENHDGLGDAPHQIHDALTSEQSDEELFQSADWDQASGRDDNPIADLIGN